MFFVKNNQKGSSLLESIALLAILSMLTISVLRIIGNVYDLFKQNMIISEIKDVQKAISGVYNFSGDYSFLFTDGDYKKVLCEKDKSIPNQMCMKSGESYNIKHRLSGNVIITPSGDYKSYSIKVDGLSKKNCIGIVEVNWVDRKKVDIYQLDINDEPMAYFPKQNEKTFPITKDRSIEKCSKNGRDNTITLYFY